MSEDNKERITIASRKDFDVSYYCGSGAGGQKRNKTASGVQIIHRESGAMGRNSESRSQAQNKEKAFQSLVKSPKFKFWLNRALYEIRQGEKIEETIDREVSDPSITKTEVRIDEKWVEVGPEYFKTEEALKEYDR